MQKRRTHLNAGLPLTNADVHQQTSKNPEFNKSTRPLRPRRRQQGWGAVLQNVGYGAILTVVLGGVCLVAMVTIRSGSSSSSSLSSSVNLQDNRKLEASSIILPLSQFSSLEYALKHSRLVGIYFAASWCPMSTPVTNLIDSALSSKLLPPPSSLPDQIPPLERAPLSLVYVSSDRSEEAFLEYRRKNWMAVPFEDVNERTALKRHFSVCSKPEIEVLGINRKFEIPTLLIIDGETHGIITSNGAEDLQEFKELAFEHWMGLHDLIRGMEEKYTNEGLGKSNDLRMHHADSLSSLFA